MSRRPLTSEQIVERVLRRETARKLAAEKVATMRDWFKARAEAAEKRKTEARKARAQRKPKPYVEQLHPTVEVETPELGTSLIGGRQVTAPYRDRRAMGARGHGRKPRRRELPGAVARRLERNRKEWWTA